LLRKKLFHGPFTSKVGMDKLFPVLPAHLEYMIALARKGVLFAAGSPIADALAARGTPFVFATGSGELPEPYRDRPTLIEAVPDGWAEANAAERAG
jgi:hypothetical protein